MVMFHPIGVISLPSHLDRDSAASVLEALGGSEHITFSGTLGLPSQYRVVQDRDVHKVWDRITKDTPLRVFKVTGHKFALKTTFKIGVS